MYKAVDVEPWMLKEWEDWVKERPEIIQGVISKHNLAPWYLMRMKRTGQIVYINKFYEDGTVAVLAVLVEQRFNTGITKISTPPDGLCVFGVDPANLEHLPEDFVVGDGSVVTSFMAPR